jgi:hypothetical protein
MSPAEARLAKFKIEGLEDVQLEGYTFGNTWNGWACPYFTYAQAQEVVRVFNEQHCCECSYESTSNTFLFKNDNDDTFGSVTIELVGTATEVYPIGNGCWVWSECVPELSEKDLLDSVIDGTIYAYLEGAREIRSNYEHAVQYLQGQDIMSNTDYTYPPLSTVIDVFKNRLQGLQAAGQRGKNMISTDYYYEADVLTDMINDYNNTKLSNEHYTLLSNLVDAMSHVSNAIDHDETGTLNDALSELNMFTISLDELLCEVTEKLKSIKQSVRG